MNLSIRVLSPRDSMYTALQKLREEGIGSNPAFEKDFSIVERRRESCSYHIAYMDEGMLVGGMRLTPIGHGLTFSERIVDLRRYFGAGMTTFDANRLVLSNSHRGGEYLKYFLFETSKWLLKNTSFKQVSITCRGKLRSIYENMGGTVLAENLAWDAGSELRFYTLISLDLMEVNKVLERRI